MPVPVPNTMKKANSSNSRIHINIKKQKLDSSSDFSDSQADDTI